MTDGRLRRGRLSLALGFFVQGVTFALLVTRIPATQDRYDVSDGLLPAFLAAVPLLAGVGSVLTEKVVARVRPGVVLRCTQPLVLLALHGVAAGTALWQLALSLAAFGFCVGALDASMNMLGVSLQRSYGRSIMIGFHAAYSLGGIVGASLAWAGAHANASLLALTLPVVAVLLPAALLGSWWYVNAPREHEPNPAGQSTGDAGESRGVPLAFRALLPLCLVMAFAYIGDSTVSNYSAKYLQDVLGGSEELATVPYNVYMVTTLLGRSVGDSGVRSLGAKAVVRYGTLLAAAGFAVVATAPGAWVGIAGFTMLGFGLCVIVPQTFAAAGRLFPRGSDAAIARLNVFNYVGFLVGSPLVGVLGDVWSLRGAMLVPMAMILVTLVYVRSFDARQDRYGGGHERPHAVDVG